MVELVVTSTIAFVIALGKESPSCKYILTSAPMPMPFTIPPDTFMEVSIFFSNAVCLTNGSFKIAICASISFEILSV